MKQTSLQGIANKAAQNKAYRFRNLFGVLTDVWFEEIVRAHCTGHIYLCRYADDFVCAFQYDKDAQRFYKALIQRLARFTGNFQSLNSFVYQVKGLFFKWLNRRSQRKSYNWKGFKELGLATHVFEEAYCATEDVRRSLRGRKYV